MSTNCLVTKLKGVVNNDNLDLFGYMGIKTSTGNIMFELSDAGTVKILHGTVGGNTEIPIVAGQYKYLVQYGTIAVDSGYDEMIVYIPKYTIKRLYTNASPINLEDLQYSSPLVELKLGACNPLKYSEAAFNGILENLDILYITNTSTVVNNGPIDVTEIGANGIMTKLSFSGIATGLTGSLNKAGMSPLTELNVPNTKEVSLSIETFVANNRAAGRTTGSLSLPYLGGCNCTFNGESVAIQASNSLSWTATTITLNGVTIDA